MKLIITRHGETDYNVKGIIQGQKQSKLTKNGINQAKALTKRLKNEKIDVIYTSYLVRCLKTSEIVNEFHKLKIKKSKKLNERKFGVLEGKKGYDVQKKYGNTDILEDINFKPKGAESWKELEKRAVGFVKSLIKKYDNKTVLIVGHKGPNRLVLNYFLGKPINNHDRIKQDPASISIIDTKNNKIKINDIKHLKGLKIIKEKKFVV